METFPCFILIQKRESEACIIECFMESNGKSSGGNRLQAGLVFLFLMLFFHTQKCEKTSLKIFVIGGHQKIRELVFFHFWGSFTL